LGKPILVCFIGIDGSGKTTLVNNLLDKLRETSESKYVYGRFISLTLRIIIGISKRILSLLGNNLSNYQEKISIKNSIFKNRLVAFLYEVFTFFSYTVQIYLKVKIPLLLNNNIVCDRYIYDTVIDLSVDLNYYEERFKKVLAFYLRVMPKPNITFLIDLPENIAFERGKEITSLEYLSKRRRMYLQIIKLSNVTVLDGTRSIEELNTTVLNLLP